MVIGAGLGFGYASSLYYSLRMKSAVGKYAGLHQAVVGASSFAAPLAAGALASSLGDPRWSWWLCAGSAVLVIAAQELMFRKKPGPSDHQSG